LALGYGLRNKANNKEEERQSTNYAEGRMTENGLKCVKEEKKTKRSKGKWSIEWEDRGRQINKEYQSRKTQQMETNFNKCFGSPCGKDRLGKP